MKKIIFLHGFFASGACVPANALKEAFEGKCEVIAPDLPLHPNEAVDAIRRLIDNEQPDLLVGNSCGSFYAQMVAPVAGVPALLGNPHLKMTEFLESRIGRHQYKSPRQNDNQDFEIDEQLIGEFAELESHQFDYTNPYYADRIWGLFGENDTLAHFEDVFLEHYSNSYHFPGGHTPAADEVRTWYVPLIEKMLVTFPKRKVRFFRHFKGMGYKFVHSAYHSETQERMVVYQKQYDDFSYWVRPEGMFFGKVTRDGRTFNRFEEID